MPNRFDVCAAYFMYAMLWSGSAYTNQISVRLAKLGYRPSPSEETLAGLSDEAKRIYGALVRRHEGDTVAADRLARRARGRA